MAGKQDGTKPKIRSGGNTVHQAEEYIKNAVGELSRAKEENMVLPLPDSESNI